MGEIHKINNDWWYNQDYKKGMEFDFSTKDFIDVNLPHANIELPYNYFDEEMYQFVSCYKKIIVIEDQYKDKVICIRFEGVMTYAKVFLNGNFIGEHKGGYTPFELNLTEYVKFGSENVLTVIVDSTERQDIPPFGGQIDYLTYGGIYRDVSLRFYNKTYIENAQIKTKNLYKELKSLEIDLYLNNLNEQVIDTELIIELKDIEQKSIYTKKEKLKVEKGNTKQTIEFLEIANILLWDIENPNLYEVTLKLVTENDEDRFVSKIGFRDCEFRKDGFYLNNQRIKLRGLNRHQSYPYVGYAMPKRVQEKDALILKNELHLNIVRTSHYPQSINFLNKCDEIGLLVFEEIPGWQHIGDFEWKDVAIENVREMILRDFNHPSIILWGIRINESRDDDNFYIKTNKLARQLDSTRQTGGVRCIEKSSFLEDVYTMNDFVHDGKEIALREPKKVTGLAEDVPYLVTEYNGHMYPTKKFDQEERQSEHVLRHLRVQNASYSMDNISGAIGWCAFDYNTHKDFGAGDRICYHGVMDMYRIKKFASYAYKSQVDPNIEPVLYPATFWARGERSKGGVLPLVILTNCDYIEVQFGSFSSKKFMRKEQLLNHLPYAPIIIESVKEFGEWGMRWEDCTLRGYVDEQCIIEKKMSANPIPTNLNILPDDIELSSEEKDVTRVVVEITDQYNNILPFTDNVLNIKVEGVGQLIGPKQIALKGGSIAFWIETINKVGKIRVSVKTDGFKEKVINIDVV